ncbi:MAG: hypothetical protein K8H88_21085, partial [Sandaracinaceae bacterium]|nr:hypothetical protein [Sandaracinaceae bacterium]
MSRLAPSLAASLAASLALSAPAHAQTWPADAEWIVLDCGGIPSFDPRQDEPAAMGARDVVGDSARPALYYAIDATQLF